MTTKGATGRVRQDVRQGRVFYTTLGHVEANWDKPEMQAMITGAIKWALKLVDADVAPRPVPGAR
jgi:type 1 glutamine amidotransferase